MSLNSSILSLISSTDGNRRGAIVYIGGCMYANKSSTGMDYAGKLLVLKYKALCIRFSKDTRFHPTNIAAHNGMQMEAVLSEDLGEIHARYADENGKMPFDVILIDEVAFMNPLNTFDMCDRWRDMGIIVIACGLDKNANREWYPISFQLYNQADEFIACTAFCVECSRMARNTFASTNKAGKLQIGGLEEYKPVCDRCWRKLTDEAKTKNS